MATRIRTRVKRGKNSLIVKIQGGIFWAFYLGVDTDARLRIAYQIRDGGTLPRDAHDALGPPESSKLNGGLQTPPRCPLER